MHADTYSAKQAIQNYHSTYNVLENYIDPYRLNCMLCGLNYRTDGFQCDDCKTTETEQPSVYSFVLNVKAEIVKQLLVIMQRDLKADLLSRIATLERRIEEQDRKIENQHKLGYHEVLSTLRDNDEIPRTD